ncbi:hypothetical protein [Algibacter sp. L3A6]|uniref:hypothetical protein n=1 Tax=Algibacter sp. L3A6 TaxID=2686366 RepID=UPI00131BFEE3|nr:hypothetical protein [Algibacter sp. L3A6]
MKKHLIFLFLLFCFFLGAGQSFKKEKRIYMLDITKSMWGSGSNENIFEDVKKSLYKGIEDIKNPETIITIIPFQATHTYDILPSWTFKSGDKDKLAAVKKVIDSYSLETVPGGYTDVYSALDKAKKNINNDRVNYIFLLTDGEQSAIPSATKKTSRIDFDLKDLESSIGSWCDFSQNSETHLFYVMLSKAAIDKTIVEIIEKECNAYVVQGTDMNVAFVKPNSNIIKLNLNDDPLKFEINLLANNWEYLKENTAIKLELENNSIFQLENDVINITNRKLFVKLKNKLAFTELRRNNDIETTILLTLSTSDNLKVLNPEIKLVVKNHKERILTLEFSEDE